ncbi:hypothetical protein GALMADRAFT_247352 [Galerina marginata CBS 339.88]|uniref:F-box domain-containing protein n=1 Tax=Galerina marginata (strain CBS 339.88) TaxID=685588 RepID=A0A067SZ28_GALM3|nr:hypothetical protein GALMADRAFT_247352 [Galerina marginata CBS 339.88]
MERRNTVYSNCGNVVQEIPYDIWRHITGFLPSEEVKKLYRVNSMLLSISLDERYKSALIGSLFQIDTERSLNRLIDTDISSRVRTFTFKPGHLCKLLRETETHKQSEKTSDNTVSELLKAFGTMTLKPRKSFMVPSSRSQMVAHAMPTHLALRNVLKIMRQMTSLTSFRVEIRGEEHWYFKEISADFFAPGWAAFGVNLRTLELRIPLEDMAKVLPPVGTATLTSLETLYVQIIRASLTTSEGAIIMKQLLPFVNHHRRTLKSLTLDVAEQTNLSPFLLGLHHVPSLESFKLKQPFVSEDETDFTGLKHFFQMHRSHLTHFDIDMISTFTHYPTPYAFFAQDCFSVALPKLRGLSIHLHYFPPAYSEGILPYIHQFKSTLVSLEVHEHRWILGRLQTLVEGFSSTSTLKELKICLTDFSPDVLLLLATNLPNLDTLNIDFETLSPEGFPIPWRRDTPLFVDAMGQIKLPTWHLRVLDLNKPLHHSAPARMYCKFALVKALPSVEYFCGLGPDEYLWTEAS